MDAETEAALSCIREQLGEIRRMQASAICAVAHDTREEVRERVHLVETALCDSIARQFNLANARIDSLAQLFRDFSADTTGQMNLFDSTIAEFRKTIGAQMRTFVDIAATLSKYCEFVDAL